VQPASLLEGFFMGIYLYSQKAIDAYKKKRKRDAAKAKKTLEKLATSSPVLQALINKKASKWHGRCKKSLQRRKPLSRHQPMCLAWERTFTKPVSGGKSVTRHWSSLARNASVVEKQVDTFMLTTYNQDQRNQS